MEGVIILFKKLTVEEQLQKERERNLVLVNRQIELENAILELADVVVSMEVGIDG